MDISRCPKCGMPAESSNYYLKGMVLKCRYCGHSGLPLSGGACIYDKIKKIEPHRPFENELSPQTVFSKLALLSFFSSMVSVWSFDLRTFTIVSFAGFIIFSVFYGVLRLRNNT